MFTASRSKLNEVEGRLLTLLAEARTVLPKAEAELKTLGKDVAAPLVRVEAAAKKAELGVSQALGPLKERARRLVPVG